MLDEEMDDIIRNAAAKHHPAYNDQAWELMEKKLDKHLPQKKDPRRFIFFLLFFLLLGSGAVLTAVYFTGNNDPVSKGLAEKNNANKELATETPSQKTSAANDAVGNTTDENLHSTEQIRNTASNSVTKTNSGQQEINNNPNAEGTGKNKRSTGVNKTGSAKGITASDPAEENIKAGKQKTGDQKKTNGKTDISITAATAENTEPENVTIIPVTPDKEKTVTDEQKKETVKEKEETKKKEEPITKNKTSSPDKKKSDKSFASNFGITFSMGPDLSFIQLDQLGEVTLTYGAGLSYSFAKRFTARAGFYVSKKIYSAMPDQYHGTTYPYLTGVDANCKVYEIPVSLSYSFGQRKNHSWFGAVGLSSFLMKTEDYQYNYKTSAGYPYTYYQSVSDENKHYFSVLTLSGGYQYQLSKRVSLEGEPYVKLPLSGIGLGKINLNSMGLLFTVTVKPFAKGK